jgi:GTP cyclohydrolase II
MQDPENLQVVYAGTTEGLYKTVNGGKTFTLMTGSDVIINDVYVDPGDSNRVLLATDRGGVLTSNDAGVSFTPSNQGISERKIAALLVDDHNDSGDAPAVLYAGIVNDKQFGGVFRSVDNGAHWEQLGAGLDGRDVFALAETKDGAIVAGTSHGIFVLGSAADPPAAAGNLARVPPVPRTWGPGNSDSSGSAPAESRQPCPHPVLVRVHTRCTAGDVFSADCHCREILDQSMRMIAEAGCGVILYLHNTSRGFEIERTPAAAFNPEGTAVPAESREEHSGRLILHNELRAREGQQARTGRILRAIGLGGQILSDLGIQRIRLLSNTPMHVPALEGFGLEIVEQVPIPVEECSKAAVS